MKQDSWRDLPLPQVQTTQDHMHLYERAIDRASPP